MIVQCKYLCSTGLGDGGTRGRVSRGARTHPQFFRGRQVGDDNYIYNIEIKSRTNYKIQITEGNIKDCPIIIVHYQNEIVKTQDTCLRSKTKNFK